MAVNPVEHPWTYEEYLTLDIDSRHYLDHGRLLDLAHSPGDKHQGYSWDMSCALGRYGQARGIQGEFLAAPFDVLLTDRTAPGTTLQPDILYVTPERMGIFTQECAEGMPDLAIEILSAAVPQHNEDTMRNLRLYREYRVPEYWLCNPNGPMNGKILVHQLTGTPEAPAWRTGLLTEIGSVVLPDMEDFIPEELR